MTQSAVKSLKERCQGMRVLYVEDDEVTQKYTYALLSNIFEHIDMVSDGQSAYDKFVDAKITIPSLELPLKLSYDLIVVDLKIPKLDGISLIAKIRKICHETAIIITSAYNDSDYFLESIRLGVNGYVLKPLDFDYFLETLIRVVDSVNLQKATHTHMQQLTQKVELQESALYDQSFKEIHTKLPNKKFLEEHLALLSPLEIPLFFLIHMDHLTHYMKLYGAKISHEIVQRFARELHHVAQTLGYRAFELSSNDFVLFKATCALDTEQIYADIMHVVDTLNEHPLEIESLPKKVMIGITVGVTFDHEELFKKAYTALDFAKQMGKKFVVYTSNLDETACLSSDFYWQEVIADTLDNDDVIPFYQPVVNACGEILKYEALMRIKTKDESGQDMYVSPSLFLDLSKRTRQYDRLSYRMIEKVLAKMFLNPTVLFSINLSERDIVNKEIRTLLRTQLHMFKASYGCSMLMFEILESEKGMNAQVIKEFLRDIGYDDAPIAVDDFGTGYSNFAHLLHLSPTHLKIDGSLIRQIDNDEKVLHLVEGIVAFAHALHVKTIAEYVHNEIIFKRLCQIGVDGFQGYFVGEPSLELRCL